METSAWQTGVALNLDWPNLSLGRVWFLALENLRAKVKDWRLKNPSGTGSVLQMRILSGIQPSGALHLGNYFGMMRPAIELQEKGEAYYFLADYHSMTSVFDAVERRKNTLNAALDFLACGLDPARCVLFKQSDVPEHTELAWMLSTITPMGLLERCHSYKDKLARGMSPNHGLFAYPVLMAADILIYDADAVPVGKDQKQHVEVTRDVAAKFNQIYGECFVLPEPLITIPLQAEGAANREVAAAVPGTDGQKMSKSYGNTIEIFGEEKLLRRRIMGLVMDGRSVEEPKPDAGENTAVRLLRLMAPPKIAQECEAKLRAGGYGYGALKKTLFEHYWNSFREMREKRAALADNLDYVQEVLRQGAVKARITAQSVLCRARKACGLE